MPKSLSFTQRYRIMLSRILLGCIVVFMLFSTHAWRPGVLTSTAVDLLAFVLVLVATFGRIWALSYISSHKTKDLVTQGPYSLTRNPLYLFSLMGAVGIGILTKSLLILAAILLSFAFYYPLVIRAEESRLEEVHGEAFRAYRARVSAFMPRFSSFAEPDEYPVSSKYFRRAFFSVMWFPLVYIFFLFLERMHGARIIPVLFTIP